MTKAIPPRPEDGHKVTFGTVGIIGGCTQGGVVMLGAPVLAATAALRSGCGRVEIMSSESLLGHILSCCSSATGRILPAEPSDVEEVMTEWVKQLQAFVIGPGLGRGPVVEALVEWVLGKAHIPVVLDADALHVMSAMGCPAPTGQIVLTPHPGEFAVLAQGCDHDLPTSDMDSRQTAAKAMAEHLSCVVVLKGHRTVVAGSDIWTSDQGGVELAVPGSGDVLAGILGGILAQQAAAGILDAESAARTAVSVHAVAGSHLAQMRGIRGLMASEIADAVPGAIDAVV